MTRFVWDVQKELENIARHNVNFEAALLAFEDPNRSILFDPAHSSTEERFFCFGKVGHKILTVRFTYRGSDVRIIGAGYWRKGEKIYEKEKKKRRFS